MFTFNEMDASPNIEMYHWIELYSSERSFLTKKNGYIITDWTLRLSSIC